ncbi:MAG: outer membrane beta-barrel protein [Zoogloeaceae bacterium]|jgi:outer membrane protein|nr:outer membrane beta-barrel protein [Zoogloeaceae bacterium]
MKSALIATGFAVSALGSTAQAQQAAEGNWLVRVRALQLDMADHSSAGNGNSGITSALLPKNAVSVSDKVIPELDISYFFTKNIAAELVLTIPQKHSVKIGKGPLDGAKVGTFKHLPPSLLLQYHFLPDSTFRPYVGAGVNYTRIWGVDFDKLDAVTGTNSNLDRGSWGLALQAGFDIKLDNNLFLNVDVKKINIRSDLSIGGRKVSTVKVDPLLWGIGIGYRF